MPLFPSDFKKFKHLKSDDKTTTLQHPKGHQIIIAHKALSKPMREQLEALSKAPIEDQTSVQAQEKQADMPRMADGGGIKQEDISTNTFLKTPSNSGYKSDRDYETMPKIQPNTDTPTKAERRKASGYTEQPTGQVQTPGPQPNAEGGQVKMYADSNAPVSQDDSAPVASSQDMGVDPELANQREGYNQLVKTFMPGAALPGDPAASQLFGPKGEAPPNFNSQYWALAQQKYAREKAENADNVASEQQRISQENQARTSAGLQPLPMPNVPEGQQIPGSRDSPPVPGLPGNPPPGPPTDNAIKSQQGAQDINQSVMQDPGSMIQSGLNQRISAQSQLGSAQSQQAIDTQKALIDRQKAQQSALAQYQGSYNELSKELQDHMADIQNHYIDPDQYWKGDKDGNGGHSKIMAGIGMILGGFNPSSKPNGATEFLKYQMDRNMDAQKQNLNAKQNLLTANLRQFGNLKDATDMTHLMQNDITQNYLQQAAAKAQSPIAKANAMNVIGQLKMDAAPVLQQFAMRRAMMNLGSNGDTNGAEQMLNYMDMTNPEVAKSYRERFDKTFGFADRPLSQADREKLDGFRQTNTAIKDLQDFVGKNTTLVPGTPAYNTGVLKAKELQQVIRHSQFGGIYREGEQPLLDTYLNSNPAGALKMLKTNPQLKELLNANMRQYQTYATGIFPSASRRLQQQQGPEAPQIKTVNGVKYMRGPNGEAIPVK